MRLSAKDANEQRKPREMFAQVSVADDKRFELLGGCPQHAFQHCAPVFTTGRNRP
jgi:hypothetical protein